jgi:hypothetical protein
MGESGHFTGSFGKYSQKMIPRVVCIISEGVFPGSRCKPGPENRPSISFDLNLPEDPWKSRIYHVYSVAFFLEASAMIITIGKTLKKHF